VSASIATPLEAARIAYPESFFSVAEVSGVGLRDLFRELLVDFVDEPLDVGRGIADLGVRWFRLHASSIFLAAG
jgi:hypothetical protein